MKMLKHKFIDFIPDNIDEGVLYISIEYCTAIHKCVCGCGNEVVTPLSPTDWKLTFDGKSVSLYPSIGNWNFDCKSHYWIKNNHIEFAGRWTEKEIRSGRQEDFKRKKDFFDHPKEVMQQPITQEKPVRTSFWQWVINLFRKYVQKFRTPE